MAYIGKVPAAAVLAASDITDGIISNAKLAQDIISADTALGATPADTDEFLVSDAGTLKRMDYSHIKASSAWTLIKTVTASSSSEVEFINGASSVTFDNTYNFYVVIGQSIVAATNNVELDMFSTNDGSSYETLYDYVEVRGIQGGGSPLILTTTADFGHVGSFGNASGKCGAFVLNLPNPSTAGTYHTAFGTAVVNDDGGTLRTSMFGAQHETAEAYTGIKFAMSSGNIASGTFSLYGVAT